MPGRVESATRNIIWGVIFRLISVLGPFVTRSLLISRLGPKYLGLNSLFTSVLQVLSLAELGFSTAIVFNMYEPVATGNTKLASEYLAYLKKIYRIIGCIILLVGVSLMPFLNLFVKGNVPADVSIRWAFLIYLVNTSVSYLSCAYKQSILSAYQRNDVISKVSMAAISLQYFAQVVVLIVFPNYYAYAILLPICTLLSNIITSIASDKVYPEYKSSKLKGLRLSLIRRREMRKNIGGLMVGRICSTTRDSLDSIIISAFLGLTSVAMYGNYFCIISSIFSVLTTINSAVRNSVGNSVATESKEKNYQDLRLFTFIYAIVAGVISSCLIVLYQPFMMLWVGQRLMLPFGMAVLFTLYYYVRTMGDIRSLYEDAAGIWWHIKGRMIVEAALNVVLNFVLVQLIGMYGVVLGTTLSLFFVNFIYGSHNIFDLYFKNNKLKQFYLDHAKYLFAAIISASISLFITNSLPVLGLASFAVKGFISCICAMLINLILFCRTKLFSQSLKLIKKIWMK